MEARDCVNALGGDSCYKRFVACILESIVPYSSLSGWSSAWLLGIEG